MKPGRVSNLLPLSLPQLQNLIKRDPEGYRTEFELQWRHLQSTLEVLRLQPSQPDTHLQQLVAFVAQVAHCFPDVCGEFVTVMTQLLRQFASVIEPSLRLCFCRQLVLLYGRGQIQLPQLLEIAVELMAACADRQLRLYWHVQLVAAIRNANRRRRNQQLNARLQQRLFALLVDGSTVAVGSATSVAKTSLDIAVELYRRDVWRDARTVNAIAGALFNRRVKVAVAALQFFLGSEEDDEDGDGGDSSDQETDDEARAVVAAAKYTRKTRKKQKQVAKARTLVHRTRKRRTKAEPFNYSALHLIYDPQGLAERLYRRLESLNERYEVKLMHMSLIARLIGVHRLLVLNFYTYLQRYLQPKQRDVTRVLQYVAQASHDLVPPETVSPLIASIANNFITERNSAEVITVGINAVKEIADRCPLALSTELLQDLCAYKKYRDKNVVMASRALIQLFRNRQPELLARKDRGRPSEAAREMTAPEYGATRVLDHIPGAEILDLHQPDDLDQHRDGEEDEEDEDDNGSWVNVSSEGEISDDDENDEEEAHDGDDDGDDSMMAVTNESLMNDSSNMDETSATVMDPASNQCVDTSKSVSEPSTGQTAAERSRAVLGSRFLTDAEFRRIDRLQLAKHLNPAKKHRHTDAPELPSRDSGDAARADIVSLRRIEHVHKPGRMDKKVRLAAAREKRGQRGEMGFGRPKGRVNQHASTTNREKRKSKSFMMLRHKLKSKNKKSFQEKQRNLRDALLKKRRKTKY